MPIFFANNTVLFGSEAPIFNIIVRGLADLRVPASAQYAYVDERARRSNSISKNKKRCLGDVKIFITVA